jgi:hypothetical protein
MEKRYQVFVSSTFTDLQDARKDVMQALLELDCIPSGMELFPAADEDQWSLIKKVIEDSDYYIVILAGRYGSIGPDGYSYTEMEYRYATELGKPVIGFIHSKPDSLPQGDSERNDEGITKLAAFRALTQQKMCRFWDSPADLGSKVSRSLIQLIKSKPGVGWVRGNLVPTESASQEILNLRRRIEELEHEIASARVTGPEGSADLEKGSDEFEIHYKFSGHNYSEYINRDFTATAFHTWDEIFYTLSPLMMNEAQEHILIEALNAMVEHGCKKEHANNAELENLTLTNFTINKDDYQTIKIQLRALGLIVQSEKNRSVKNMATYWTLTPYGDTVMTRLRAKRKTTAHT